jgi:hypothetical protein
MRVVLVLCLIACGGTYKSAGSYGGAAPAPPSVLEQQQRIDEPATNAQASEQGSGAVEDVHGDVAVRHRVAASWQDIIVTGDDSQQLAQGTQPPPPAQPMQSPVKQPEKLVVEAWIDMESDNVGAAVEAIRRRVEASGGRIVSENGQGRSAMGMTSAALVLRVPPAEATATTAFLATLGTVTSKRVLASDVSKRLFDQELALENLKLTMERLQKLASQSGPIADLLTIEKEMTRVRGEIEAIKGEQRFLIDRVELATITVSIVRTEGAEPFDEAPPEARIYPGAQLAILTLFDPGMRERTRVGGGATVRLNRHATFELDVFPRTDGETRAVLATFGTALYSSFLRDGRRRYLNPYIGGRVGGGYLSGNGSPVIAGELGVELVKHEYLLVEASVRVLAYVRTEAEVALHSTLGLSVPF